MGSRCVELSEAFLEGFVWILLRGKLNESNYLGDISKVEGSHTVVELVRLEVTPLKANWASVWENQTLALSVQNSESLTVMALMLKGAVATGSDIM